MNREEWVAKNYPPADHELTDEELKEQFGWLVDEFLGEPHGAIWKDATYLARMLEDEVDYRHKQDIWSIRTEVERAVEEARRRCSIDHRDTDQFTCTNESACGFHKCAYAKPQHIYETSSFDIPPKEKLLKRPSRNEVHPLFSQEQAITATLERRGVHRA